MFNLRTDLAIENREIYRTANKVEEEIPGIETQEEKDDNVLITRVKVKSKEGENALKKPVGTYVTIEAPNFRYAEDNEKEKLSQKIGKEINQMLDGIVTNKDDVLVVGLGNLNVTPDALGPKVTSNIDITRHILHYAPQYIDKDARPVSAISPGVLGTTGIETVEILRGIVDKIKPKAIIAVDALASRKMNRISSTIQIADTGICPGAGVGNNRKEITKETLGIPVIAIGVPTVVEAATIASDTIELFVNSIKKEIEESNNNEQKSSELYKLLENLQNEDKYQVIKQLLSSEENNYMVTPKEIDQIITDMSEVIAKGVNIALV